MRRREDKVLNRRMTYLLAAILSFSAPAAYAFLDPPWITPAAPRAGEVVSVNIRDGICDAIFFRPGYPQITQLGNAIHLVEYGHHWDTQDLCVYEIGHLIEPIGVYPPGNYTVTVDFAYDDALYGPTVITIGVVEFAVVGATTAAPVPVFGNLSLVGMLLLVSSLAFRTLRARRPSCC
jgi:hypothetical protein